MDCGYPVAIRIDDAPKPAADVRHLRAGPQLGLHAVQRGQPRADQVGAVAGPEEPLAPGEHVGVVGVPAHPRAGAERPGDLRLGAQRGHRELERPGHEQRAVRIGQRECLLLGERVFAAGRVVLDVAAGGLAAQPLVDVAGCGAGPLGQLLRPQRSVREGPVQPEPVADHDVARRHGGAEVADEPVQEAPSRCLVDRHVPLLCPVPGGTTPVNARPAAGASALVT